MAIKDIGKGLKTAFFDAAVSASEAVDTLKEKAKEVELPDLKKTGEKATEAAKNLKIRKNKKEAPAEEPDEQMRPFTRISTKNAIRIFYYMMAADGEIGGDEEEKLKEICKELCPEYDSEKDDIIGECRNCLNNEIDPVEYYDVLEDEVGKAIRTSAATEDSFITPKLLVWDLLAMAYSDGTYHESEQKLMKYIVKELSIDKAVFTEMESSVQTLIDIENEIAWLKTTDKPYLTIEAMINELADRKSVIFASVKDLILL